MTTSPQRAAYGAAASAGISGRLPTPWPRTIGPNAMAYLREVVESGLQCDMVTRFERAFAAACGVKHCIAAPGCTAALTMLAAGLPFRPGDEIVVSPVTDYGTIAGIVHAGLIPVFADTDPGTVNLSVATIAPCITDRTRALLVVHKTGLICDMDPICALAARHGLMVIEDACQAVFGEYKGRLAGTLGQVGAFSFDSEKTMGSDVGGCLITDSDDLDDRLRFIGQSRGARDVPGFGREHREPGHALRMPQCTAAMCLAQLEIAREQVAARDRMIRLLTARIAEVPGITPLPIPDSVTVYSAWMFGMSVDAAQFSCTPEQFAADLAAAGIPGAGLGRYYLMPDACPFLEQRAAHREYPYSMPPASRPHSYAGVCPTARHFLQTWIRWSTFCERYTESHCDLAADIIRRVADRHRR